MGHVPVLCDVAWVVVQNDTVALQSSTEAYAKPQTLPFTEPDQLVGGNRKIQNWEEKEML